MTKKPDRPFLGIDGEGGGSNRTGQQHYLLLGAGQGIKPLNKGRHLRTVECLDWICDLPPEPLLVGFSFGYDTTQILRDLDPDRLDRLFADKDMGEGRSRYTWFGDFGIEYLPKNYLRVCRLRTLLLPTGPNGRMVEHTSRDPATSRTIYETFGLFQSSFLKALQIFDVGRPHWTMIERNKASRSGFVRMTKEIIEYNRLECELLAELMVRFRAMCHEVGIRPRLWSGAGKLAAAEHDAHHTITALDRIDRKTGLVTPGVASLVPPGALLLAGDAYYGGRFEVTRVGLIEGPVWEYDIRSAYPAAMLSLPCLDHGRWEAFDGEPNPAAAHHVAHVTFRHPADAPLCGLPIRKKNGQLFWPREGQGVYWSTELDAARRIGAAVQTHSGWQYFKTCDCQPFQWVSGRYEQRRQLGSDQKGYPVKLALNSLYGKLAQRIGSPRWGNLVWAGMITAQTRAWLLDAAGQAPADVLMFATDAVFSRQQLTGLSIGPGLGEWEAEEHARLFVVQPGIYWGAKRPKTRGIPASLFRDQTEHFESTWNVWCTTVGRYGAGAPECGLPVPLFTGLRLSHARGKPETRGKWLKGCEKTCQRTRDHTCDACRRYSFDWTRKRDPERFWETPTCVRTRPAAGAPDLISAPHKGNEASYLIDLERAVFDEQQDHIDLTPP